MRLLYLGQVTLRKGIAHLLEAVDLLDGAPVEVIIAGPVGIRVPARLRDHPAIRWLGPVARGRTGELYRTADAFILPTLSDGFAITQLEALSAGLPLIVSRNCGDVVVNGDNGLLLEEVSAPAIAEAVLSLVREPDLVARLASSTHHHGSTLADFGARLEALLSVGSVS